MFLQLLALLLNFLCSPRDCENDVSNDKGQVKNIIYFFFLFLLPFSIPDSLVLSCSQCVLLPRSNPFLLSSCTFVRRLSPWLVLQWRIIKCVRGSWGQRERLMNWELSPHQLQRDGEEKHSAHWTFATNFSASFPKTKCKDFIILL